MKTLIEKLLAHAMAELPEDLVPAAARNVGIEVENTRDAQHGDFASNLAMRLAKATRQNPRKLAETLVQLLPANPTIAKVDIAGAGFINFHLSKEAYHAEIAKVLRDGRRYGRSQSGAGRSAQVEFVSANPTGPLHVGHGRHAAYGASVANLLEAVGYRVEREYYINDSGRQMDILAVSTWLRYLEYCGERFAFPANGYRGDYIAAIGERLFAAQGPEPAPRRRGSVQGLPPDEPQGGDKDAYIDALISRARTLIGEAAFRSVLDLALAGILDDIREDLKEFGVTFDCWFSERQLSDNGSVDRALDALRAAGHAYLKDGAWWFKSTDYGDEKDRVMVRENGVKTYFASDIAYVFNKLGTRLRSFALHLGRRSSRLHHPAARRPGGARRPRRFLRGAPGAVRVLVPRRGKGANVDPFGRVRHLARLAQGGGQRCGAAVLRHAQQ